MEDVRQDLDILWVAERTDTVLGVIGITHKDGKVGNSWTLEQSGPLEPSHKREFYGCCQVA
jgi:hypothetical protein